MADLVDDPNVIGGLFLGSISVSMSTIIDESHLDTDWDVNLGTNGNPVDFKIDNQTQKTYKAVITNEVQHFIAQEGKFCV